MQRQYHSLQFLFISLAKNLIVVKNAERTQLFDVV